MPESPNKVTLKGYGAELTFWSNPKPTVDIAINWKRPDSEIGIVMIYREVKVDYDGIERLGYEWDGPEKLTGYALPGGYVDFKGDPTLVAAAKREAEEETGLELNFVHQVGAFGDELRDYGRRNITIAYSGLGEGDELKVLDEKETSILGIEALTPEEIKDIWNNILFDHTQILHEWDSRFKRGMNKFPEPGIYGKNFYRKID